MYEHPPPPRAPKPKDGDYTWNNFAWISIDHVEEPPALEQPEHAKTPKHHHLKE